MFINCYDISVINYFTNILSFNYLLYLTTYFIPLATKLAHQPNNLTS